MIGNTDFGIGEVVLNIQDEECVISCPLAIHAAQSAAPQRVKVNPFFHSSSTPPRESNTFFSESTTLFFSLKLYFLWISPCFIITLTGTIA